MNAGPGSTKAKFSSITEPDIYYDGGGQKRLFDFWNVLKNERGVLHKEITLVRCKMVMAHYNSEDELEADELEADGLEADDGALSLSGARRKHWPPHDADAETTESRRYRLDKEGLRAEEACKEEKDECKSRLLKDIDGCLDRAVQACENAAAVWLKGKGCIGHVNFIAARTMDAVHKIRAELDRHLPEGELPHNGPAGQSAASA